MAKHSESQETETAIEGRNQQFEKFSVSVNTKSEFYLLIKLLNKELGHGRQHWHFAGRPLRKIKRYSTFNHTVSRLQNSQSNSIFKTAGLLSRPITLTLKVPLDSVSSLSKVFLQFEKDK